MKKYWNSYFNISIFQYFNISVKYWNNILKKYWNSSFNVSIFQYFIIFEIFWLFQYFNKFNISIILNYATRGGSLHGRGWHSWQWPAAAIGAGVAEDGAAGMTSAAFVGDGVAAPAGRPPLAAAYVIQYYWNIEIIEILK